MMKYCKPFSRQSQVLMSLKKKGFENVVGKGENAGQHFSPFPNIFSNPLRTDCIILTPSHTMTPFDASRKEAFRKHRGKRRNCLYKQFLLFPQCFLLYQRQKLSILLNLSSANAFNLEWSKILSCGKGLRKT